MNARNGWQMIAELVGEIARSEDPPPLRGVPDGELREIHAAAVSRGRPPELDPAERDRMVNEVARRTDYTRPDMEGWSDEYVRTAHNAVKGWGPLHGRAGLAVIGGSGGERVGELSFNVRSTLGAGPGEPPESWKNSEGGSSKSGSGLSFECPPTI